MNVLIIANGTLPPKRIIDLLLRSVDYVICADGGANSARKFRIMPDVILGDFDSITAATRKFYKNAPTLHIPDQYSTDLEKAIQYCIDHEYRNLWIIGATGSRLDHTTGALGCFKEFRGRVVMNFVDTEGTLSAIAKKVNLTTRIGEKISLIPLERCSGITTTNLKYPLKNDFLELGIREGISNEATAKKVTISVRKGTLLLYRFHKS